MEKETRLFIAEVRRFHGIESSNPDHVIQSRAPTLGSFADDVGDEDGGASDLSLTSVLNLWHFAESRCRMFSSSRARNDRKAPKLLGHAVLNSPAFMESRFDSQVRHSCTGAGVINA